MLANREPVSDAAKPRVSAIAQKARSQDEQIRRALVARAAIRRGKIALAAVNAEGLVEVLAMERPKLSALQLDGFLERIVRASCRSSWHFFYLRPLSRSHAAQEREMFARVGRLCGFELENGTGPLVSCCMSVNTGGEQLPASSLHYLAAGGFVASSQTRE